MKTKHVAQTAGELLRMISTVRPEGDNTPSICGALVIRENTFEFISENGDVEGVTLKQLLSAIAERCGFSSIEVRVDPPFKIRQGTVDIPGQYLREMYPKDWTKQGPSRADPRLDPMCAIKEPPHA